MTVARRTMSGLEYMRKIVAGEIEAAPMARLLNIRITSVEEGNVIVTAEPAREFENGLQIAHGGFAGALLDTALGCAVNSVMPAGKIFTTLEMKINYTRAVTRDAGTLTCNAHIVHAGGRTATAEGRVVDKDGKLYAHGTATFILFRDNAEQS
ncbi:MAG TPA: PaaI family thioesterase [Thermoanaerobaculia bacterium]|nr:PaaI family thioesterase [Thermoanaerobaculia bacterium]